MLDILFKSYFVFVRKREDRGAAAAVFALSIPLSLNVILLLLFFMSFFIDIKNREFGGPLLALFIAVITFTTGMILRSIYLKSNRYKSISNFKYPVLYSLLGITYYLFSLISFTVVLDILLTGSDIA